MGVGLQILLKIVMLFSASQDLTSPFALKMHYLITTKRVLEKIHMHLLGIKKPMGVRGGIRMI